MAVTHTTTLSLLEWEVKTHSYHVLMVSQITFQTYLLLEPIHPRAALSDVFPPLPVLLFIQFLG